VKRSQVIVSWGDVVTYPFDLDEVQPMPHDQAREWLDQQFVQLGCEPLRPTGKVLLADKVLAVATAAGQPRFSDEAYRPWAKAFARAVTAVLVKPVVRIDVPSMAVTF
jgi:histidinol-phosphate/aromatic aminotransferase/cobyric acid decarboxylase-like protein